MWILIKTFVLSLTPSIVAKVLAALGFAAFSYAGLNILINNYFAAISTSTGHIDSVVHSFLNIAGFDQVFTIIGSAFVSRLSLFAMTRLQRTNI